MKKKKKPYSKNKYYLAILSLLCVILMILSVYAHPSDGILKNITGVTAIPVQKAIRKAGSFFSSIKHNFDTKKHLIEENETLREKISLLMEENNNLQSEKAELQRLRELLKLDRNYSDYEKAGAHVIGKDPGNWFSTFTIDKGSADGIKEDMNVLSGGGLAGIVTKVGPNWAAVRSVIDDMSNISAMTLTTADRCIVRGDLSLMNEGKIRFEKMENNENAVRVGDEIVTSHISDKYLQGILIGYISEINVSPNNLTRFGYITPAVDFKNLQEVLVIMKTKAEFTQ